MSYKTELREQIEKSGRSRKWISKQLEIDRTTFWRKVNDDTFNDEDKEKIKKLLST